MGIRVSVIVPTCRRADLLKRCLDALLAQTLDHSLFEIIVVDDGPTSESRMLVEEHGQRELPRISYLEQHATRGPASARNRGWRAAEGDLIAFTDDDCLPEPDWLKRGIGAFRDGIAGVSGRVIVPCGPAPNDYERNTACIEQSEFVTANCFYRKTVLAEVGGFDERFTMAWREDADLYFTLLERNEKLLAAPEAVVVHPVRTSKWGVSVREQRKSMFNALLYKKHPSHYTRKIRNPVLGCYYASVLSAFACLASLVLGLHTQAAAASVLWLVFTGCFCMRRLRGTSLSAGHVVEMALTSVVIPFQSVYWRLTGAVKFNVLFY